jgi:hypothetical protein
MLIKRIDESHWDEMVTILTARPVFQGVKKSEKFTERLKSKLYAKLKLKQYMFFYGAFEKDKLIAFMYFTKFPNNPDMYSICTAFGRMDAPKTYGNRRADAVVDILNYVVPLMEKEGRIIAWNMRPVKQGTWNYLTESNNSILKDYTHEIVETVLVGQKPTDPRWVWFPGLKKDQQIVRITKPQSITNIDPGST